MTTPGSFVRSLIAVALAAASLAPRAVAEEVGTLGYYRFPAIHGETVVFTAEGDLWRTTLAGGLAQRLTTHLGEETRPAISPDGRWVAYSATYEGPTEAYVMPVSGGV
ncbi:MAG: Tricorn protease, partial [Candidatus Eisenbacteria bacterium]